MSKPFPQLADREWLIQAYETKTTWQIAEELGCRQSAVHAAMKRHEIPLRAPRRAYRTQDLQNKAWLEEQYEKFTTHEIAKMVGCGQITVWRWMKKHGIPLRKDVRRKRLPGYIQLRNPETGKQAKMHRYLMEQHLSRKLEPNEHVHHIDGNPENNSLDNLIVLTKVIHHRLHAAAFNKRMKEFDRRSFQRDCVICQKIFHGGNVAKYCPTCRESRHG